MDPTSILEQRIKQSVKEEFLEELSTMGSLLSKATSIISKNELECNKISSTLKNEIRGIQKKSDLLGNDLAKHKNEVKEVKETISKVIKEVQIDGRLFQEITGVKQDVAKIKYEMAVKQEVANLKQGVANLKQDVADMRQEVTGLYHFMAEMKQEMKICVENMKNDLMDSFALNLRIKKEEIK